MEHYWHVWSGSYPGPEKVLLNSKLVYWWHLILLPVSLVSFQPCWLPLFYFSHCCSSFIIHSWLVPSSLLSLCCICPLHLLPPLLSPDLLPALTQPRFTRPPLLLPLPFLIPPPRWLPLPHPHPLLRPSSGRSPLAPSLVQSAFPTSFFGGALTVTGIGLWGKGRERFGLIQLPPPPTTTCPRPLHLLLAWSKSMGMLSPVEPTIAPCWPTFTPQPGSSLLRSSLATLKGRGRRRMTQVWERDIFFLVWTCAAIHSWQKMCKQLGMT